MYAKLTLALVAALPLLCGAAERPLIPVDHFVERDTYSMPRLSPDGRHIAVNVRVKRNGRMASTISIYSLPELKNVSMIAMPVFELPTNMVWVSNSRVVATKGREQGGGQAPQPTGEVVAINIDAASRSTCTGTTTTARTPRASVTVTTTVLPASPLCLRS